MNIVGYTKISYTEGPGIRTSLWVSGCPHRCRGCFNQAFWSKSKGREFTDHDLDVVLKDLDNEYICGISLLGGEPLADYNVQDILKLMRKIKEKFGDKKDILVYTGFTFEHISDDVLELADIIIDGKYVKDMPTKKPFRGSDNQRMFKKIDGSWELVD
ncbi:anaerobic ribonucleoside-triphosphate reductase activating protein [Escherichia coli]|uniref:anaerobic ribonucleoside-triphosphate reductase activating protein n=1 Tax=Escherichia coli TaxID=562 RepID=UPI000CFD9992|nr:anaerobic ribonucleoside-triphosphate reductase activating protein [Escherichia coli]